MQKAETASQYELLKILLDFVGVIVWPLTVLVIVLIYRKEISGLIINAQRIKLPGGIESEVRQKTTVTEAVDKPKIL